jgi:hypothetical protein
MYQTEDKRMPSEASECEKSAAATIWGRFANDFLYCEQARPGEPHNRNDAVERAAQCFGCEVSFARLIILMQSNGLQGGGQDCEIAVYYVPIAGERDFLVCNLTAQRASLDSNALVKL